MIAVTDAAAAAYDNLGAIAIRPCLVLLHASAWTMKVALLVLLPLAQIYSINATAQMV